MGPVPLTEHAIRQEAGHKLFGTNKARLRIFRKPDNELVVAIGRRIGQKTNDTLDNAGVMAR